MGGGLLLGAVVPAAPAAPPGGAAGAPPAAGPPPAAAGALAAPPPAVLPPAVPPGPAAAAPIAAGAAPAVGAAPGPGWKDDGGPALGPNGEAPAGWSWVMAEDVDSFLFGSVVQVGPIAGIVLASRAGRRGIVMLAAGISGMAFLLEDWRRADFIAKWRGSDHRILARAPGGGASRSWLSVTESAVEVADPQFVLAPRSASWCVAWLLREGGPIQHHENWKARKRLSSSDYGVAEHHTLSTVLEDLASIDEVNVSNLVGVERLLRKLQMIEHFWEEKQREQDSSQTKLPQEEVSAFMGGTGSASRPSSMVCPALLDVVGMELERVSQLKKNARKLREEAKAAPGAKAGGGKS